jgi:hypothetical protein
MNIQKYLAGKLRRAGTKAVGRALLDVLSDLEEDSRKSTHQLDVFDTGIMVNVDVAERKLYGAVRKHLERKLGLETQKERERGSKQAKEPEKTRRDCGTASVSGSELPGLDPNKKL